MRTVAFFISLCFYLLSGGSHLHADTSHARISNSSSSNLANDAQDKFTNGIHTTIIIDDADFDLDEEYFSSNTSKEESSNKVLVGNYFLLNSWYLTNAPQHTLNRTDKFFKISHTLRGNSSPIYIKNRTLRI